MQRLPFIVRDTITYLIIGNRARPLTHSTKSRTGPDGRNRDADDSVGADLRGSNL